MIHRPILILVSLALILSMCGCDFYTTHTKAVFDTNATASRHIADAAATGALPPAEMAYELECFARTFQNFSDAGHWKQPTYPKEPTTQPTTLPWNNKE